MPNGTSGGVGARGGQPPPATRSAMYELATLNVELKVLLSYVLSVSATEDFRYAMIIFSFDGFLGSCTAARGMQEVRNSSAVYNCCS